MNKLPPLSPRKLIKKLTKLGFVLDHTSGSHAIYYHSATKRRAVVPIHNRDLPQGTLSAILRESGVSRDELLRN